MSLKGKVVLVTGGTGSFGQAFVRFLLEKTKVQTVRIYSRDEHKQSRMESELIQHKDRLRFFLGDVRDLDNLRMASEGVDIVVHAAAYKIVQKAEAAPFEVIKTNVLGTQNAVRAAWDNNVELFLLISTDKAVEPINLYGASKMTAERLVRSANYVRGSKRTKFCAVRYGNVAGSAGSVIPLFRRLRDTGRIPINDPKATRFLWTLPQANKFVLSVLKYLLRTGQGGEICVPKLPSVLVTDLASAIAPLAKQVVVGPRPGDKRHESMIAAHEKATWANDFFVLSDEYLVPSEMNRYSSGINERLTVDEIRELIDEPSGQESVKS